MHNKLYIDNIYFRYWLPINFFIVLDKKTSLTAFRILMIFMLLPSGLYAQKTITKSTYLKNNINLNIAEKVKPFLSYSDKNGFLWIANNEELTSFDGNHFSTFSLKDNFDKKDINAICEDDLGNLYVATTTEIYRYNKTSSHFVSIYKTQTNQYHIFTIAVIDSSHIYLAYNKNGFIYFWDGQKTNKINGFYGHTLAIKKDYNGGAYIITNENKLFTIKDNLVTTVAFKSYNKNINNKSFVTPALKINTNGVPLLTTPIFSTNKKYPWYRTLPAWVLWCTISIFLTLCIFMAIKKALKKRQHLNRLVIEEQLKSFRAQINPHLLQNMFEFLQQSLHEHPLQYTQKFIVQLASYLRKVLDNSNETYMTMEEELAFADEYLTLSQLMFPNRFTYSINVDDEIDVFAIKLPSILLQPILENAIKHGVRFNQNHHANISIHVYANNPFIYCDIENSRSQNDQIATKKHKPQGIFITEQRLKLFYNKSHKEPSIAANSTDTGYKVTIKIPQLFIQTIKKKKELAKLYNKDYDNCFT